MMTLLIILIAAASIVMIGMVIQARRQDELDKAYELTMQGFRDKADNEGTVFYQPKKNEIVVLSHAHRIHSAHGSRNTRIGETNLLKAGYVVVGEL